MIPAASLTMPAPRSEGTAILIIDDDREFCGLIERYLTICGYAVHCVHTGVDAMATAPVDSWHAIILNVLLPDVDALEVLKAIRRRSGVPVLMVGTMTGDADSITSLDAGADDYLTKGESSRQLLARLRAITRRASTMTVAKTGAAGHEEIAVADLRIVPRSRKASLAGHHLALTPGQFNILLSLAKAQGQVKTRDRLSAEIRYREYGASDPTLEVQVSCLRRKLGDDPKHPRFIRTVRSSGYMLVNPDAP